MAELEYNELLVLNTLVGYNIKFSETSTVADLIAIIEESGIICDTITEEESNSFIRAAKACIKRNSEFGKYMIVDSNLQSRSETKNTAPIVTFANGDDVVVVYWGTTGPDEWYDNIIAGDSSVEGSKYQNEALAYIDALSEKYSNITVTGHSKGGNKAQYVALMSDRVDRCVAFDGQGFSLDFITDEFNAARIAQRRDIITVISSDHDIVNALIYEIAGIILYVDSSDLPREYLGSYDDKGEFKFNFFYYHKPNIMLNEDGHLYNYEGVEPATIVKFVDGFSEYFSGIQDENIRREMFEFVAQLARVGLDNSIKPEDKSKYIMDALMSLDNIEALSGVIAYAVEFAEGENLQLSDIASILEEVVGDSSQIDKWYMPVLWDALFDAAYSMSADEFISLCKSVSEWAKNNDLYSWDAVVDYISEDPVRLLSLYASLDMDKETVHKAVARFLSPDNLASFLASFATEHPFISSATVAALSVPDVRQVVMTVAGVVSVAGVVYLTANHIIKNWDKICESIGQKLDYIKEKIADFYVSTKQAIREGINNWTSSVFSKAEQLITRGSRFINSVKDKATSFLSMVKDETVNTIKRNFAVSHPFLYIIASKVYREVKGPVKINVTKLRNCVETLTKLATRVANIDTRLDNLYYKLARNNIEQEKGVFTSLANLFNLFRADLNVDEGASLKRQARALSALFEGYEDTEEWILNNVPKKI